MKRLTSLLLLLIIVLFCATTTQAASPSPSATPKASPKATPKASPSPSPEASPSPATNEKLRERIERVIDEKRDQVQGVIDELSERRRGLVGEVQRVSAESVTLKTARGTTIIPLTEDLKLLKKNKTITIDDIAVGDWAVALGHTEADAFQAEHLLISSTSLKPVVPSVVLGSISEITKTTITLKSRATGETTTLTIAKTSKLQDPEGTARLIKEFQTDIQALAVGVKTENGVELRLLRSLVPLK
jgi:hypothetical protein